MSYIDNNDLGEMIDLMLNTNRVQNAFIIKGHKKWISKIDDDFLKNGVRHLNNKQIALIEKILFEHKTILDCANEECITVKQVKKNIRTIKNVLIKYM